MGQRTRAAGLGIHVTDDLGLHRVQPLSAITSCLPGPLTTPPDRGRLGAGIIPGLAGQPQSTWGHEQGNGEPTQLIAGGPTKKALLAIGPCAFQVDFGHRSFGS
jgi:hypothetical protein